MFALSHHAAHLSRIMTHEKKYVMEMCLHPVEGI